jgi:hypothetical protein
MLKRCFLASPLILGIFSSLSSIDRFLFGHLSALCPFSWHLKQVISGTICFTSPWSLDLS